MSVWRMLGSCAGAVLIPILLTGCYKDLEFTLLSVKPIDLSNIDVRERVLAEDCALNSPFYWGWPSTTKAIDKAIESGKGDLLVDVEIKRRMYFVGIGMVFCEEASGQVARTAFFKARQQ